MQKTPFGSANVHVAVTAWNGSDGKLEELLTRHVTAPSVLTVLPPSSYATGLYAIPSSSTVYFTCAFNSFEISKFIKYLLAH